MNSKAKTRTMIFASNWKKDKETLESNFKLLPLLFFANLNFVVI